jgi:hypothetical protein
MSQTLEAYLLAALLISIAIGVVVCFLIIFRRIPRKPPSAQRRSLQDRPDWPLGIGVVVVMMGLFSWLDLRDEKFHQQMIENAQIRNLINAGYLHPDRAWLNVNLNECGPRTDGMTDQVLMVITTEADGKHVAAGCSRIAERKYIVRPKAKQVQG